jgi:hypothetical protein
MPRRRRAWLAAAAAVAALSLTGWGALYAWGNGDAGRASLKGRAEAALRARFGPVDVGEARLDPLLRARLGPLVVPSSPPGTSPLLRAETATVRPRLIPLLAGRVELASVLLHGLFLELPGGDGRPPAEVGPFDLDVDLHPGSGGLEGSAVLGLPGGGSLAVDVRRRPGGAELRSQGTARLPADLPAALAQRLPFSMPSGSIQIRATGQAGTGLSTGSLEVDARATGLTLAGQHVGPGPVGPIALRATGRVAWNGAARRVALEDVRVTLGESDPVSATIDGAFSLGGERSFSLSIRADAVPWQALLDALPPDLAPPPSAPRASGTLSARGSISGPLARRDLWDVQVDLDLDDLRRASRAAGPTWLASGFEWKPIDPAPDEPPRRIAVGPGNPAFVPYAEIPQSLVRAVTASEDGGFFGHRGFDFREIANAVTEAGRARGASTISQQLAKNLFLSPERTLARKVREALSTVALEANLPKARLLEIYLNIAEWGPGIYGVGEAARFWFGKDARDLSPRESAFLATVIPSPRRFHARLHRSGITPWWNARIDDVLGKMRIQNQLDDAQLAAALSQPLAPLAVEHPPGPGDPDAADVGEPEPAADDPAR